MLVLSRKPGQQIEIAGGQIRITILEIRDGQVKIGVNAPAEMAVHRQEIAEAIRRQEVERRR